MMPNEGVVQSVSAVLDPMVELGTANMTRLTALERLAERRVVEGSLYEFERAIWPIIEPGREFMPNYHIQALAEHLEAVTKGEIQRLVVNVPPGTGKSLMVSISWPCWAWARDPYSRWLFASYSAANTVRDSRKRREVFKSPWFRNHWHNWRLKADQDTAHRFENSYQGFMLATSTGAGSTGEHANTLVYDDPHDRMDRFSKVEREKAVDWYRTVFTSLNLGPQTRYVIVAQRITEDDMTGYVLANELGYEHLCIPLLWDSRHPHATKPTKLGWLDPRKKDGEVMWPAMFPEETLTQLKREKGSYDLACTPGESPVLMADWKCKRIDEVRPGDEVVGFRRGTFASRARLIKSTVIKTFSMQGLVCRFNMESGRTIRCTRDHRWYTTRKEEKKGRNSVRREYASAKVGTKLMFVDPPYEEVTEAELRDWYYLAGIIDGEGCVNHNHIIISQSPEANPDVWQGILAVLNRLKVDYKIWTSERSNDAWCQSGHVGLRNTRETARKILRLTPLAKAPRILKWMFARSCQFIRERDRVKEIQVEGVEPVYALQTTSGNYVVWGYASSNSQYQQNPTRDEGAMFPRSSFCYFRSEGYGDEEVLVLTQRDGTDRHVLAAQCQWFQTIDTALEAKDDSAWTVCGTFGITPMPASLLVYDVARERLPVPKQYGWIIQQRQRHPRVTAQYVEKKASGHGLLQEAAMRGTAFGALKPGDKSKEQRLVPASIQYENGVVYHRAPHQAPWLADWENEICGLPNSEYADQGDVLGYAGLIFQRAWLQGAYAAQSVAYGPDTHEEREERETRLDAAKAAVERHQPSLAEQLTGRRPDEAWRRSDSYWGNDD